MGSERKRARSGAVWGGACATTLSRLLLGRDDVGRWCPAHAHWRFGSRCAVGRAVSLRMRSGAPEAAAPQGGVGRGAPRMRSAAATPDRRLKVGPEATAVQSSASEQSPPSCLTQPVQIKAFPLHLGARQRLASPAQPCSTSPRSEGLSLRRFAEEGVTGHIRTILKVSFISAFSITARKSPAWELLRRFVLHTVN